MSKIVSFPYKLARVANDLSKLTSGDPRKIARRAGNKAIGRKVGSKIYLKGRKR